MNQFFKSGFLMTVLIAPSLVLAHTEHTPSMSEHASEPAQTYSMTADEEMKVSLMQQLLTLLEQQLSALLSTKNTKADMTSPIGNMVMTTDGSYRYFYSDGLPEYGVSGNGSVRVADAHAHEYRVPLKPVLNSAPTYYSIPFNFGVAMNGVVFEPFAAEWYKDDPNSGWQEDPFVTLNGLNSNNAHIRPGGLYHYHGQPTNLMDGDENNHSSVLGFASDGFPLYGPFVYSDADDATSKIIEIDASYGLKPGMRPSGGPMGMHNGTYNEDYMYVEGGIHDLDQCNGRFGVTPEFPEGTYYYVATESYPYIPRCLMGDQDPSFVADHHKRM